MSKNLLVELLVEELPPKSLKQLGNSFAELLTASLKAQDLVSKDAQVTAYASPRRLAVHITHVAAQAADKAVAQKLMPATVGLDAQGQATPPLLKKLASLGADASVVPQLKRVMEGKTETLFWDSTVKGTPLTDGLQKALEEAIGKLPIPKVMTYQLADGWSSVNFVRPVHALIALHGADIVPVNILGLQAGRETQGHRFEAKVNPIVLHNADSYAQQLATEGAVIAGFAERRAEIVRQLNVAATKENLTPVDDDALLDEVTALVEHPNVLVGKFAAEFLQVPQECLILTMKANQKYFPLLDAQGKLANKFLLVSNIRPTDPGLVIGGNERVVRSRLADAKFFFDQDRKKTLESRVPELDKVVYHNKLGTQGMRMHYVRAIAKMIGELLGGDELAKQAYEAATLAKADLLTDMVGEFPELQGIMGRYYAQHEGLSDDVAFAIEDHYKPRFAGDTLPRNPVGVCLALADKLETLVNMFKIGEVPTGDKDPFALRRHALGIIRILIEKDLSLELDKLVQRVIGITEDADIPEKWESRSPDFMLEQYHTLYQIRQELLIFFYERLAGSLRDQGYTAQEVDAVLSLNLQQLSDIPKRLAAVRAFAALPESVSLAAANKRVGNILKKTEGSISDTVDTGLLQEPAEQALYQTLTSLSSKTKEAFDSGDYTASLQILAALKSPVDTFFDHVMVNVEDESLRNNRLALLAQLHQIMNRVADLSKLAS
ncbi:MAG: glycine--tRNA ligase subunit beta [Nitrosomonas sp.]|uniref:glycine--tRNA ligase subunit beta n=3 Tax=Nitrosomonas sp. TaxID=42353 RepID=UPI00273447B4|nr:glycine--tRNA ligase subunit beta [Nitrosomonas sp.]MDP3661949.1 glycine--tRNA ligase subunit beta [Nitrosomonas sp.]MDZ4106799.1 glycine--tRNA ligase subunit beta [Nitrosomonas sp.]